MKQESNRGKLELKQFKDKEINKVIMRKINGGTGGSGAIIIVPETLL